MDQPRSIPQEFSKSYKNRMANKLQNKILYGLYHHRSNHRAFNGDCEVEEGGDRDMNRKIFRNLIQFLPQYH